VALTPDFLVRLEKRYAPNVGALPGVFSEVEVERSGDSNAGGDKMGPDRNGYADVYAEVLSGLSPSTVVELGVFQGVSLAMWCDLFPDARVVGLDLDFVRFDAHLPTLKGRGAFGAKMPTLIEFDAYGTVAPEVGPVDLFIDDGPHTEPAIRNVLSLFAPQMSDRGVYVVEDFAGGDRLLAGAFPEARIVRAGRLNVALL
jgi:hypothetical protein